MRLFDKSAGELSDDELRVGCWAAAQERDRAVEAGDPGRASHFAELAAVLAAERDSRAGLGRAVDDATAPFTVGAFTIE